MSGDHDMTKAEYVRQNMRLMLENQQLKNRMRTMEQELTALRALPRRTGHHPHRVLNTDPQLPMLTT